MSKKATRQAYGEALVELGKINKDIVVLDADLTKSTKTSMLNYDIFIYVSKRISRKTF